MMKTAVLAFVLGLAAVPAFAAEKEPAKPKKETKEQPASKETAKPYPLDTCIVSGEKLKEEGKDPVTFVYKGQEIKLCCNDCREDFDKDPAKYLKKLEKK
ncbi:hypothetical protein KBB96_10930 [Luteolibacter ambystomatis]|uniref:TRASH domain-containing protein n=1 Tax=Luteolibacter ambystomatis TaxID=2824561 RepID=A0A975G5V2_9BACT|nr:hypothetical protein [Luteolibacter ambystomatis]QUE49385.1 hypothetical protein KBB96_10930 [Luteolibacter ambystomatis]